MNALTDIRTLLKAFDFAAIKHSKQRRKDPESTPYVNHVIGVAKILVDSGIEDINVLQAALLHDTVEDTDTTFEELEIEFGHKVTEIVREVTDDKSLGYADRKRLQIETAPFKSNEAKLVKVNLFK
jgi:(p)ppGpp synthase/HD superfamily hydrolase